MCRHGSGGSRLYDPTPVLKHVSHLSLAQAGHWLEVSPRQMIRWRHDKSWMQYGTADRLALLLGCTPEMLWPDFGEPCCETTVRQHGYSMYVHDRCRCDECMAGLRAYTRDYNARNRDHRLAYQRAYRARRKAAA